MNVLNCTKLGAPVNQKSPLTFSVNILFMDKNNLNFLEELNEAQRKAVEQTEGPLLVLAGAGAGKTKTVTYRILNLIYKGVAPENILAVTFTNKAAKEMRERLEALLEKSSELNRPVPIVGKPFVATFHSLGVHIIKENAKEVGLTRNFAIYDRSDSKKAIKDSLEKAGYNPKEFEPNKILGIISREKGNFVTAENYEANSSGEYFEKVISSVWKNYDQILKKENALDFDDLLLVAAKLLEREDIREKYSERFKYIHIDEYQDTNKVQYKIAESIAQKYKNICVVGDIDQNIYSWRGANIRNILGFEKDYQNAKLVVLEENYRSTQTILAIANRAIEKNKLRREKKLVTRNAVGEKVTLFEALDENHEAEFVALKIKKLVESGARLSDIAVLYRANFQSRALEEACIKMNINYQVLGTKFFERKEVKDIISFLRYSFNPESITDLKRVINTPPRGIGKTTLLKIVEGKENDLPSPMKAKLESFRKLTNRIKDYALENKLSSTIMFLAEETGLNTDLEKTAPTPKGRGSDRSVGEEGIERKENIKELSVIASRYDDMERGESVEKFLEEVSLASDQDSDKEDVDSARLMTVHASKGLEFPYVFIVGLEEGLFPYDRNNDENVSAEEAEEERRLFYVAVTRARKKIFLSYAQTRTIFGSKGVNIPSEFVLEIPEEYLDKEFLEYTPRHKPLLHIEF